MGMSGGGKGVTADINVTPLIDVVLVLLIIFMVITPMLQRGFAVQLPEGADPSKKPDSEEDVIISISYGGPGDDAHSFHYHAGEAVKENNIVNERVQKLLNELQERAPGSALYIKADKRLRWGVVKRAMLWCEAAGFKDVALVAESAGDS